MKYLGIFCMSVFLLLFSCSNDRHERAREDLVHQSPPLAQAVNNKVTDLNEKKPSTFQTDATRLKDVDNLRVISFSDEMHGWVGGEGKIYRTADAGKNWTQVAITLPPGSDVKRIFFLSPSLGWVVLQKPIPSVLEYQAGEFWIMQTIDGGQSWRLQHGDKEAVVTQLSFADQNNGWITGIKYLGPARYTQLILRTTDQGQHWTDVSENFKRAADKQEEKPGDINQRVKAPIEVNDGIMRVIPTGVQGAKVITSRKAIFLTNDGGMSWQPEAFIRDEFDQQSGIRRFGENDKALWVAAGADSVEGTRGVLMVQQPNNSWSRYELGGAYFSDAVSLLRNQFVASGYIKGEGKKTPQEGVVLYSSDGGQSWSIIYRSAEVNAVNALSFVGPNQVMAVGSGGLFLRAQRL